MEKIIPDILPIDPIDSALVWYEDTLTLSTSLDLT
jgi:hypothetical protein